MRPTTSDEITRHPELEGLEGYLWRREGARLAWLAERVPADRCIVEIGSNRGKSSCFLAAGSKVGHRVKVHCCDLWETGGQGEFIHLGFDLPETHAKFREQVSAARCKSMVVEHQGDSVATAGTWDGPPVGLLFIDGDHRYEAVKADYEAWLPHVDGWVAFHDYTKGLPKCTRFPGVVRFVDELKDRTATRTGRLVVVER